MRELDADDIDHSQVKPSVYPEVIKAFQQASENILNSNSAIEEFQDVVRYVGSEIVSVEERSTREYLTNVEGELELVLFTVSASQRDHEAPKRSLNRYWLNFKTANQIHKKGSGI